MKPARTVLDLLRGALIGVVEIIPGVSGGTIALIIGVYETLIDSAGEFVHGVVAAVIGVLRGQGLVRAREHFGRVQWDVVLPVGIGMIVAVLVAARIVAPLVAANPETSRAFFAGLILVSLIVPARMVGGRWFAREWVYAILAAVLAFWLTGLPVLSEGGQPPLWVVALAAAVAICALALPGLSGSFLLLVFGLYATTLEALNDRDLVYIGTFVGGAVIGLALFVQILRWLLVHRRRISLSIMTGLMAGSMRSLWPWQGEDRQLLPPGDDLGFLLGWFVLGMAIVAGILAVEAVFLKRRSAALQRRSVG